ncbi:sensor histidine kinase [Paenimyroides tangerinum]|uniref:Sensor histidine kinase n=1 Tax=Paenimyroides tangerinum TaxID=2488728 RepID=A0A3P3WA21_9FLAO|nr:sensor histidine kinase [Paenimyroides tangerinum]RRJ91991.1 sensor histidine kinase [Paenimyroides tangerinum]
MLKKIFFIISFSLICNLVTAQHFFPLDENAYLSELYKNVQNQKDKKKQLLNYLLLSEFWAQSDSLKSWNAIQKVQKSNDREKLDKGVLDYFSGIYFSSIGNKAKAKKHYQNAIDLLKIESKNNEILVKTLYNYAYIQVEDKGYDFMVKTLIEECIPLSQKMNNLELLAFYNTQLGLTFMSIGQFDTAEEYHKKALDILNKIPEMQSVHLITYLNLVSNYCYKPDSRSAKVYLDKAKNILLKFKDSQYLPNYYYQEAMYHTTREEYDMALLSLEKGIELAKEKKQFKLLHMLYFRVYNVFLMQKDYLKARNQLEQILNENILSKEPVNRKITFSQLAAVNEVLGDYKQAFNWMKKASVLSDSLQQQKILEKMNELEIIHKSSEKQEQIAKLEREKEESVLITKNKNLRITILAVALLLSLIIAFLIYLTYKKQQKINKQINLNHKQELLYIEKERKYEATQAILQGEEQERQRIAQDLHDSMGGMLANIKMTVSTMNLDKAAEIGRKIDATILEMRRISRNLMPETLKNLGLEIALRELCESMSQKNFTIQFEAYNLAENITFQTQLALYRITQEAISNVIKYAQADIVIVQISQNEDTLILTIEDDGIGFEKSEIAYGLGLKNIENRTRLINGSFDIVTEKGNGTTLNIVCNV